MITAPAPTCRVHLTSNKTWSNVEVCVSWEFCVKLGILSHTVCQKVQICVSLYLTWKERLFFFVIEYEFSIIDHRNNLIINRSSVLVDDQPITTYLETIQARRRPYSQDNIIIICDCTVYCHWHVQSPVAISCCFLPLKRSIHFQSLKKLSIIMVRRGQIEMVCVGKNVQDPPYSLVVNSEPLW